MTVMPYLRRWAKQSAISVLPDPVGSMQAGLHPEETTLRRGMPLAGRLSDTSGNPYFGEERIGHQRVFVETLANFDPRSAAASGGVAPASSQEGCHAVAVHRLLLTCANRHTQRAAGCERGKLRVQIDG